MDQELAEFRKAFVEEIGGMYAAYGWKRLNGLIVGLLLATDKTLSLDDIAELLGRSKGPISESVRELAAAGLLRKVAGPENRRDYYVVDPDLFYRNHLRNMQTVRRNREVAERYLREAHAAADSSLDGMKRNLQTMHAFYTLMESFYGDFSAIWQKDKLRRGNGSTEPTSKG